MFLKAAHGRRVFIPLSQIRRAGCNCCLRTRRSLHLLRRCLPPLKVSCGFARCCIVGNPAGCWILKNEASFQIRAGIRHSDIHRGAWRASFFLFYDGKFSIFDASTRKKLYAARRNKNALLRGRFRAEEAGRQDGRCLTSLLFRAKRDTRIEKASPGWRMPCFGLMLGPNSIK